MRQLLSVFVLISFLLAPPAGANTCAELTILAAAKKVVRDIYKNRPNGGGVCALGVRQSLQASKVGNIQGPMGNAIDYIYTMPRKGFVDSGIRDPKKAPRGSILVFSAPKTAEYLRTGKFGSPAGDWVGHVTIKGDDGYYYTDGRTAEPAQGWSNDRNLSKTRNVAAIFVAGPTIVEEWKSKCVRMAFELEDTMSPKNLILASIVAASTPAWAASPVERVSCQGCQASVNLTNELSRLSFLKKSDRNKGTQSVEPALAELRKFLALQPDDSTRLSRFEALVGLTREILPYDMEGQMSQALAQKISKDEPLRAKFNALIDSFQQGETRADRCKNTGLQAAVKEQLCLIAAGVQGQDHHREDANAANHCIQGFNFEECLKTK